MSDHTPASNKAPIRFPEDANKLSDLMEEIEKATESNSQPVIFEVREVGLADLLGEYLFDKGFLVKVTCLETVRDRLANDSRLHAIIFESFRGRRTDEDLSPVPFRPARSSTNVAATSCPHCGYPFPSSIS